MEKYIPMLELPKHRSNVTTNVLNRNQTATQSRYNFRISLESLWMASSSDSIQPHRGGGPSGQTTMRHVDVKTERTSKEVPWYERHLNIIDPPITQRIKEKNPQTQQKVVTRSITAIVDYQETVQHQSESVDEVKDLTTNFNHLRLAGKNGQRCSFRINNRSATPNLFHEKQSWNFRTRRNIPYTNDFRLPKIKTQQTVRFPKQESLNSRFDITIKASPREGLFYQKQSELVNRNLSNGRRYLPSIEESRQNKMIQKAQRQHTDNTRTEISKSNHSSLDDDGHIGPIIKVSVTIGNEVTHEPRTPRERLSPQIQEPKITDPLAKDMLSGYANTKEFIESTNRLSTPPRPNIIPFQCNKLGATAQSITSTKRKTPTENKRLGNSRKKGAIKNSNLLKLSRTKVEKASQTVPTKLIESVKPQNVDKNENGPDIKPKEVEMATQTNVPVIEVNNPYIGFTRSPRSTQSSTSRLSDGMTIDSDILTNYQRERLASIWRNRSLPGVNPGSTGYTPSTTTYSATPSVSSSQAPFASKYLSAVQCAVRQFPIRESNHISKESTIFKRKMGRIIPKIMALNHPSIGTSPSSQSFDESCENRTETPVSEFVECVNVGSVILKKKKKKWKPVVLLPDVKTKTNRKEKKGSNGPKDSKTVLPPLANKSKPHRNTKDCDCDECGKRKVKKGKKSPRVKGLPKIDGASPRPRKVHAGSDEEDKKCDILDSFSNEADRLLWVSEQQSEKLYVYPGYIPPRIVLLSSKLGKLHAVQEMIRKDTRGIILIPYDFDTCSFTDLLETIAIRLKEYHFGSRAKSLVFLCQGGPGYAYILRNFAVTPQKLKRKDYKPLVQFLKLLGGLMSKIDPHTTAVHFLGFNMTFNKQGRELVKAVRKSILPNIVKVEAPLDNSIEERLVAMLYFDYKLYLNWKMSEKDATEAEEEKPRSWSSLAHDIR